MSRVANRPIQFVCVRCRSPLEALTPNELRCPQDDLRFKRLGDIWRFLPPERAEHFARFLADYEKVRQLEGRGSDDPAFYRELPFTDLTGKFAENWRIRARSYVSFLQQVLAPLHKQLWRPLRVLDLGAGNGWLSNRLTQLGHKSVAVDILTNGYDGLGAARHYPDPFDLVQAEFQHLPFPDGDFDLAVFNASLHYAESYEQTLAEALRVLTEAGLLVVLDSPVYHDPESGKKMVQERETYFTQAFGFPSDALESEHFLTFRRLEELAARLQITWKIIRPRYGLKWRLKPLLARLRGAREPAKFLLLVGKRR